MYDIIPAVRAQAVRALIRLQQPTESDCPIIESIDMPDFLCGDSDLMWSLHPFRVSFSLELRR